MVIFILNILMKFLGGFCGLNYIDEFITMEEGWAVRTQFHKKVQPYYKKQKNIIRFN